MSNEDDVTTAFTDHEFTETSDKPIEIETPTEGLKEYGDTLVEDEGDNSNNKPNETAGYANDEEESKESKKDALKKPYGKLGMYKDALNYDFDDEDENQNSGYGSIVDRGQTPKPTSASNTNATYHNDVHSDDDDFKTSEPTPTPNKLGGYQNDNEDDSDGDHKDVTLDQGSYMQQPMDDVLGLGSSPPLRQMSVPKVSLGYQTVHSDNSESGKIGANSRAKVESYVATFNESESDDESGSFESLRGTWLFCT